MARNRDYIETATTDWGLTTTWWTLDKVGQLLATRTMIYSGVIPVLPRGGLRTCAAAAVAAVRSTAANDRYD